jgi:hypothetical protein
MGYKRVKEKHPEWKYDWAGQVTLNAYKYIPAIRNDDEIW